MIYCRLAVDCIYQHLGRERVEFNANWILSPSKILNSAAVFDLNCLHLFKIVSGKAAQLVYPSEEQIKDLESSEYTLCLFVFEKNRTTLMIDQNEDARQKWIKRSLQSLSVGDTVLDAGAGELKNRKYCSHLDYISQDFCEYSGAMDESLNVGLDDSGWDTSKIDLVSDIASIPADDQSFDAILCSEVFEHVPDPTRALDEFARLLKPGGTLILTAPFASMVHMAPYHYCTGFSRFWYEHHLPIRGFEIVELVPNGDWFSYLRQELTRLGGMERRRGNWSWPLAYGFALFGLLYFKLRGDKSAADVGCFGYHCRAIKK